MLKSYLAQLDLTKEQQEYYYKCIVEIDPETERVVLEILRNSWEDGYSEGYYDATYET